MAAHKLAALLNGKGKIAMIQHCSGQQIHHDGPRVRF